MSFEVNIVGNVDIHLNKESSDLLTQLIVKKLMEELNNKPKKKEGRCFARGK